MVGIFFVCIFNFQTKLKIPNSLRERGKERSEGRSLRTEGKTTEDSGRRTEDGELIHAFNNQD